jgi:hypothetical protein
VVIAAGAPGEWRPLPLNADKTRRMGRIINRNGWTVIFPLDIVVPVGPFGGAKDSRGL